MIKARVVTPEGDEEIEIEHSMGDRAFLSFYDCNGDPGPTIEVEIDELCWALENVVREGKGSRR